MFVDTLLATRAPLVVIATAIAATGCGQQPGGMGAFPPAQVSTRIVQPASYPVLFEYVGQTAGSKDAEVRAQVTGIVERRLYQEGAAVRAGQPLFQLDARPYAAQLAAAEAELARARAQKKQAEREAARLRPLAENRAIGQKEADDAASAAELAAATVQVAQAKVSEARLNLSYTRVVAPITGVTSRAQHSEGSLATANTTLMTTVSQIDPIWVLFSVSESEQLRLNKAVADGRLALPAKQGFAVRVKLADGSLFPRSGRINFADTRVNPQTGSFEMRAEIDNPDFALKPGQFVRVVLQGAERRNALAVPQTAVLEGPQGKFVYLAGKDKDGKDIAQPRPVVVGDWSESDAGSVWLIESGLTAGERVLVDGIARIMMPNTPIIVSQPNPTIPASGVSADGSRPPGSAPTAAAASTQR